MQPKKVVISGPKYYTFGATENNNKYIKIVKLEFLIKLLKNIPFEIPVFSKMILGQSKADR